MTVADETFLHDATNNSAASGIRAPGGNKGGSSTGGSGLVHGSILLFSTALGIGLFRHGGMQIMPAAAAAVVAAASLTLIEAALRRSSATRAEVRRLAEANERLHQLKGSSEAGAASSAIVHSVTEVEARDQTAALETAARRERDAFDDSDIAEALAPLAEQVDLIEPLEDSLPHLADQPAHPVQPTLPRATLPRPALRPATVAAMVDEPLPYSSVPEVDELDIAVATPAPVKPIDAPAAATPRTYRPAARTATAVTRGGDPELTAIIERAITTGNAELHLQPIARLSDRKARFYEVFPRLKGAKGETLSPAEFMPAARFAGLALPLEQAFLSKGLELLERLSGRGKAKPLFVAMSRTAIADEKMRADVLDLLQRYPSLVEYLILEFEEGDLFQFGPAENASLDAFTAAGLVFAMTKPTTLEFDVDWLRDRKFAFIKVPATLLLEEGDNTTALGQRLGQSGLQLVIEQIGDEMAFAHAQSIGAVLGQGSLFSEPRPVRPELLSGGGV